MRKKKRDEAYEKQVEVFEDFYFEELNWLCGLVIQGQDIVMKIENFKEKIKNFRTLLKKCRENPTDVTWENLALTLEEVIRKEIKINSIISQAMSKPYCVGIAIVRLSLEKKCLMERYFFGMEYNDLSPIIKTTNIKELQKFIIKCLEVYFRSNQEKSIQDIYWIKLGALCMLEEEIDLMNTDYIGFLSFAKRMTNMNSELKTIYERFFVGEEKENPYCISS